MSLFCGDPSQCLLPSPTIGTEEVQAALRLVVRLSPLGDWAPLAISPLVNLPLIDEMLTVCPVDDPATRGQALYALLRWSVDQLRPADAQTPDWRVRAWRAYLLLYHHYFLGMTHAGLAARLGVTERAVQKAQRKAIALAAQVLIQESAVPKHTIARQHYLLDLRFRACSPLAQMFLAMVAACRGLTTTAILWRCLIHGDDGEDVTETEFNDSLAQLQAVGLLQQDATTTHDALFAPLLSYLQSWQGSLVQQAQHRMGVVYQVQGEFLEAARAFLAAADLEAAVTLLWEQRRTLINAGPAEELLPLLNSVMQPSEPTVAWARLKLLTGEVLVELEELTRALDAYSQALVTTDPELKATAYYRRARALCFLNLDEAQLQYDLAIETLVGYDPVHPLLAQVQIDKAWLFIQERPNLLEAEKLLRAVEALIKPENQIGQSHLANGWAGLYQRRQEQERALAKRQEAWDLAAAAQDKAWMMHISRNLGNDLIAVGRYTEALATFVQSRDLAVALGNRAMIGFGDKALGECHFWLGNLAAATEHYLAAYAQMRALKRLGWVAYLCYDLAEVSAHCWRRDAFQQYYDEGVELCRQLRDNDLLTRLIELDAQFAWLTTLNGRQVQALQIIKTEGAITHRAYQILTQCAQRQAVRDLNELCHLGLVQREGNGRATQYLLAQTGQG